MSTDLAGRWRRIYSAIGELADEDIEHFPVDVIDSADGSPAYSQDFTGGLTDDQVSNRVHTAIHNVANLRDHLKKWARGHDRDPNRVDEVVRGSPALSVIVDLANRDKHGGESRDGGFSGRSPQLRGLKRGVVFGRGKGMRAILTEARGLQALPDSAPIVVEFLGWVFDGAGEEIGRVQDVLTAAVGAWEILLAEWSIIVE
jgi:hypothetical protein